MFETTTLARDYAVLYMGASLCGFQFERQRLAVQPGGILPLYRHRPYILLTRSDIRRWRFASRAVRSHAVTRSNGETYVNLNMHPTSPLLDPTRQGNFLVDRARNWPADIISFTRFRSKDVATWVANFLTGFGYGAIHLLAWYAPFSTYAEDFLWKISGFVLLSSGANFALASSGIYLQHSLDNILAFNQPRKPVREPGESWLAYSMRWYTYLAVIYNRGTTEILWYTAGISSSSLLCCISSPGPSSSSNVSSTSSIWTKLRTRSRPVRNISLMQPKSSRLIWNSVKSMPTVRTKETGLHYINGSQVGLQCGFTAARLSRDLAG